MSNKCFLQPEDFELFAKYGKKYGSEYPEAHKLLRQLYDKLGVLADGMRKYGYIPHIRRNPKNQGQRYEEYHWAQLTPEYSRDSESIIFFVVDFTSEGLGLHIDCNQRAGYQPTELAKNLMSWEQISVQDVCGLSEHEIIQRINSYCNNNKRNFLLYGREFGIKTCINLINMEEYISLLKGNNNLIFTGAPGTGKTYLAKQIAAQIILGKGYDEKTASDEEKNKMKEQCGFVQFHPSYDYTDFVEGLRPIQDENGNVGFERRDGVFKSFCETAMKSSFAKGSDNFDEIWDKLVSHLNANSFIEIPLLTGARNIRIELNEYGTGLTERLYSDNNACGEMEKVRGHSKFFTKEQLYNIYRGFKGVPSGGHDNYRRAIIDYLKKNMGLVEYSAGQHGDNGKKFVFIIDEINRGDISKIFGELFFSIDPGYRGMDGAVRTQYANMQTSPNEFDIALKITDSSNCGHFFVPENVYIIGTMNDIDRSVESMDFAMRRRFAFVEVRAEERVDMIKENQALHLLFDRIEERMKNLNYAILTIQSLSTAYQIGAAYYLKLKNYLNDGGIDDDSWNQLWDNHLRGLLFEYLRGLPNEKEDLNTLQRAYNLEDRYLMKDGKPEKVKDNA